MTSIIYRKEIFCENDISLDDIIANLEKYDYIPLITKAKSQFLKVFDENAKIDNTLNFEKGSDFFRMGYRRRMAFSYEKEYFLPFKGEIFYSPDRESLLYIMITEKVTHQSTIFDYSIENTDSNNKENKLKIEVGYIGDKEKMEYLNHFIGSLSETLPKKDIEWTRCQTINPQFLELSKEESNKFVSADTITEEEIGFATILENQGQCAYFSVKSQISRSYKVENSISEEQNYTRCRKN